jgi:hypothetical protein
MDVLPSDRVVQRILERVSFEDRGEVDHHPLRSRHGDPRDRRVIGWHEQTGLMNADPVRSRTSLLPDGDLDQRSIDPFELEERAGGAV